MSVNVSFQGKPPKQSLVRSKTKLNSLYNDGKFSDVTISFRGKEIKYKAHKAILATSSSIFEQMLFGSMAIAGSELELQDDNPEAFKIVLAHCYEVSLEPSDIDEALEVYILADKYFLEDLRENCSDYISSSLNSDNVEKVLEISTNFNFEDLERMCDHHLKVACPEDLFALSQNWLNQVLESGGLMDQELIFDKSWKCPSEILKDDTMIQIFKSEMCKNLTKFSGCISAKALRNMCWDTDKEEDFLLSISFTDQYQPNDIFNLLEEMKFKGQLFIHLQCQVISPCQLGKIPTLHYTQHEGPDLFLSNVDDNEIEWTVATISSLRPAGESFRFISFPSSKLTLSGFKILMRKLLIVFADVTYPCIDIVSSNMKVNYGLLWEWFRKTIAKPKVDDDSYTPEVIHYDTNDELICW